MAIVDTEICLKANCPFADKRNGICSRALIMRRPKAEVCISTVDIRMEKK